MNITINDVPLTLPSGSMLSDALAAKEIKLSGIATALNGTVIPLPLIHISEPTRPST